jgi:hypothetical protein
LICQRYPTFAERGFSLSKWSHFLSCNLVVGTFAAETTEDRDKGMMKIGVAWNQRLTAWLLTLTLLLVALPSGASWQCLDGTPCPPDCPMLAKNRTEKPSCQGTKSSHCEACPTAPVVIPQQQTLAVCPLSQCVLKVQAQPEVALNDKIVFYFPLLALPPPVLELTADSVSDTDTVSYHPPLDFYPQRFLRPCLGRAPPILL